MTLGSLFDGIGGWLLAALHSGVKPLWRAEIDDFPRSVSEYHFPNVKSYTDVRQMNGAEIEPVDIICAGSPCQNLSIAGNRKGLHGSESSLFYESIRIVREMRRKTNGLYPRFFVWENVPGAFSSNKGNDFRTVLEEITETTIPIPKSHRWANAGMVRSRICETAWRVLDAQYWGVAQRRRRIFLVADFRKWGGKLRKYFLSSKACLGILRRAKTKGKEIPKELKKALERQSAHCVPMTAKA